MTNDSENNAFNQLEKAQVDPKLDLDFVAGYDTGFGAKPSPAPLLAFSQAVDIAPSEIAMVGDSLHTDILGGAAAGMTTVLITDHGLFRGQDALPFCISCDLFPDWIVKTL